MSIDNNEKNEDILVIEENDPEVVVDGAIDSSKEDEEEKRKEKEKKARRGADNNSRRGEDSNKKIKAQWMKIKEKEAEALRNSQIAAAERAKNLEYEKITAAALEENLNTKRELLTERLYRAQESGDSKKSAEITVELGKIEAQAAQIERYKIENQISGKAQAQEKVHIQQQQDTAPVSSDDLYDRMSPAGKKWLDENRDWYDASGEAHDPEKSADVTYYAQTLEAEYVNSGRGAEIGTRAYFKKIDDYIKNNWGDDMTTADDDNEQTPAPQSQRKNYAAPVGNRNPNSPANPNVRKEYKITQSEKEMALSLDAKDKTGKPLSDNEKIKRFISIREGTPQSGPISIKTINKGA